MQPSRLRIPETSLCTALLAKSSGVHSREARAAVTGTPTPPDLALLRGRQTLTAQSWQQKGLPGRATFSSVLVKKLVYTM